MSCPFYLLHSYATVIVEIKNHGSDAFKPEAYGDLIIVERRITESTSSTILKDYKGPPSTLLNLCAFHL